jgi:hypothetical protein
MTGGTPRSAVRPPRRAGVASGRLTEASRAPLLPLDAPVPNMDAAFSAGTEPAPHYQAGSSRRRCYCGAAIAKGRLGFIPWVHLERRIGPPHYARLARRSELGRTSALPPAPMRRGPAPSA